ncbi:hypothetical protein GPV00_12715 [Aeromonas hydrophila]|nr:hypothetical protein [Aeromonas hydrophila]
MTDQCSCGQPLNHSVVFHQNGQKLKSCPNCSEQAGVHVFYRAGEFGFRRMASVTRIQSWCRGCRAKHRYRLDPVRTC